MKFVIIQIVIVLPIASCKSYNTEEVHKLLYSGNSDSVMRGVTMVNKSDTPGVQFLFNSIYTDMHISHKMDFLGQNVYQVKMQALKRISRLSPPNPLNDTFDTVNVEFYRNWAKSFGYLRK